MPPVVDVILQPDGEGFILRDCASCGGDYMWDYAAALSNPSSLQFCPLCGKPSPFQPELTKKQQEQAKAIIAKQALVDAGLIPGSPSAGNEPISFPQPRNMTLVPSPCHPETQVKLPEDRSRTHTFCSECGAQIR